MACSWLRSRTKPRTSSVGYGWIFSSRGLRKSCGPLLAPPGSRLRRPGPWRAPAWAAPGRGSAPSARGLQSAPGHAAARATARGCVCTARAITWGCASQAGWSAAAPGRLLFTCAECTPMAWKQGRPGLCEGGPLASCKAFAPCPSAGPVEALWHGGCLRTAPRLVENRASFGLHGLSASRKPLTELV